MVNWVKKKCLTAVFLLAIFGMLLVEPCVTPVTVPMFPSVAPKIVSVKINSDHKHYPPVYSTNPYTGETTVDIPGRYSPKGTIEITIKNRHFKPYTDKDGNQINIYYTIFAKRTIGVDMSYVPDWTPELESIFGPAYIGYQSDTDYTVITFTYFPDTAPKPHLGIMYEGTRVFFRVQAVTGYFIHSDADVDYNAVYEGAGSEPAVFEVTIPVTQGKNPKPTTTIVISSPDSPLTSNPSGNNPFSLDFQRLNTAIIAVSACIIASLLTVITYQHKQRKNKPTHF
jgi:hypothetical protein